MAEGNYNPVAKQGTWTLNMPRNTYTMINTHYVIIGDSLVYARANFTLTGQPYTGNSYIDMHDSNLPEPKTYAPIIGMWQVDSLDLSGTIDSSPNSNKMSTWFYKNNARISLSDYIGYVMSIAIIYEI